MSNASPQPSNGAAEHEFTTAPTIPAPPNKVCSCCHQEISDAKWESWPTLGLMEDGDGGFLDLRNCSCGTTLAREATREIRGWEVA